MTPQLGLLPGGLQPAGQGRTTPVPASTALVNNTTTQHITAGMGTDRFAWQKAIKKGNRDLDRLAGRRR